ncbi:MAG: Bro-N domain-containing protein [Proteobacteria bacterium]|nr:Bro-N domain-containing protein [Desulfocapsa sp.]MBU3946117.1 Bro-N domain-containing protein [Pseudomonadota bacterium]MCG2742352.1 Bro-N domain-containing protein [Desulfobacteraceae bacterium]MBU3982365.1 Bro-N domain-containing protein [Pseudomonadota bacterium]MBU4027320.1 Bro-N domain-containing protein [Pseudomonadota bacterium]
METKLIVFKNKGIRRILHDDEWHFAVVDVVAALTDSDKPRDYWYRMKKRELEATQFELSTLCRQLKLESTDGKKYQTEMANTEGIFRIIQSIPSPKAEPFKRWLAKVGYERVQEIEDPELATKRTKALYRAKGYSDAWIEKRMRGIAVRAELTDEWQKRGVNGKSEYSILTAEISKAAFGVTPTEYKNLKGLERENLRDHMTDLELIFSMLGEAATTEITRRHDAQGFGENKTAARKGGRIAGEARENLEQETGEKVVSSENYLSEPEGRKRLAAKKSRRIKDE